MTSAIASPAAPEIPVDATAAPSTPAWGAAGKALMFTIALRVFYSLVAAFLSTTLILDSGRIATNAFTDDLIERGPHPVLYALFGVWERFDTLWYIHIANRGYDITQGAVFYPLYPALIRACSWVTHWDLVSALLITNLGTFFFFWGALRLFERHTSPRKAVCALMLWGLFPNAFIFFAGYPDSLLLAFTLWCLYFATRSRWTTAGLLGLAAGTTKAFGCLAIVPVLYLGWRKRDWRAIPASGMILLGPGCFQLWLHLHHFPSTAEIYRTFWATSTSAPWFTVAEALRSLAHGQDVLLALNFGLLIAVLAAGYLSRVPVEYRLYCAAAFCMIATKDTTPLFQSSVRYSLVLFAAFPAVAQRWEGSLKFLALLSPAIVLNLFLLREFLDWGLVV